MSKQNDGGPAFPSQWEPIPEGYFHPDNPIGQTPPRKVFGMSLRDYFAGQALAGMMVGVNDPAYDRIAAMAYEIADAVLAAR